MKAWAAAAAVIFGLLTACSAGPAVTTPPITATQPAISASGPSPTPTSSPAASLADVRLRLTRVATLEAPLAMAVRTGDPALYVAEQGGKVMAIRGGSVDPKPVLDVTDQIVSGGEQGLLGLVFSPDGRYLYVNYTDLEGNTNVVEYAMSAAGQSDVGSRREVLYVKQPYPNHNGGNLAFGPDGFLYVGLGDGGSGGDPDGNGQSLATLLGKMLRIEPRMPDGALPPGGSGYAIPPGNPFVGRAGARPEIWAYGLRNPWRYSFDRATGDLWIGDVGQDAWEEVDVQPAGSPGGANYGWNLTEGTHLYGNALLPANWARPLVDYSHGDGSCAVTGGYVYRGTAIPGLVGAYVYADFCVGDLVAIVQANGKVVGGRGLGVNVESPASFGQDGNGDLYVISLSGGVSRLDPA